MNAFKPCGVCGAKSDARLSPFCSRDCALVADEVRSFGDNINQYRSEDTRIFFYDFAFGDLCDLWSTYLLRRVRTRDLAKVRKVDRALERLEKAILTKLNRHVPSFQCETRKVIAAILPRLVGANAQIWDWKDRNWGLGSVNPESWTEYKSAYQERDSCRQQLDELVEGHTMTTKSYENANVSSSYDIAKLAKALGYEMKPRPDAR